MQALLSFDRAPPFAAPLRFFITAPLFALLAGVLLLVEGPGVLASRWTPAALAATHLITVGFMLHVMLGALVQILPVVAGANVARPLLVATVVHGGLVLGTLALVAGFLAAAPGFFLAAAAVLAGTALVFLASAGTALFGVPTTSPTIGGLKLAFIALAVVVGLGVTLVLALALGWSLPLVDLVDLHAGWGLGAWAGILLASLAYVVVPMFQLTPGYPARPSWWFPWALFAVLVLWSLAVAGAAPLLVRAAEALAALAGMAFAAFTLNLQRQRRRARADATYRLWQVGLASMLLALAMLLAVALHPELAEWRGWTPLFGILVAVGGYMSLILGMLYKIVPFLSWLHLQNLGKGRVPAPNMSKILSESAAMRQTASHVVALAGLVAAAVAPAWFARPAGLALVVASGWLFANFGLAYWRFRRHAREMACLAQP